jgi:hypothetical protein
VVEKLGGFTAGSVTGAEAERIKAHLLGCPSCRATQDELRDVCSSLRAHAGVLVLALPALAGGVGSTTGLAATVKSVLFGSKVKVGLALVSAAAAGVVGVTAGPVVFGTHPMQNVGLGGGAPELALQPPAPRVQPPPQVQQGPRIVTGELQGTARPQHQHPVGYRGATGAELGANAVPNVPGAIGSSSSAAGQSSSGGSPRDDLPGGSNSTVNSTLSTESSTDPRVDTQPGMSSTSTDTGCDGEPTLHSTYAPPPSDYLPPTYEPPSVTTTPTPTGTSTSAEDSAEDSAPAKSTKSTKSSDSSSDSSDSSGTGKTSSWRSEAVSSQNSGSTTSEDVTGSADSDSSATP